jgi:hypothetical protein
MRPQVDSNCDKQVDVDDLLDVINHWNLQGGGPANFNADGIVGVPDLMIVIDNWS